SGAHFCSTGSTEPDTIARSFSGMVNRSKPNKRDMDTMESRRRRRRKKRLFSKREQWIFAVVVGVLISAQAFWLAQYAYTDNVVQIPAASVPDEVIAQAIERKPEDSARRADTDIQAESRR